MSRRTIQAAAAALALLLPGSAGDAYLVLVTSKGKEIRWDLGVAAPNVVAGEVTFHVDTANVPDVTGQQFADAVRASTRAWGDVPASIIAFREDPARATSKKNSSDRINRFGFNAGVLPPFAFAAAFVASTGGRITDVDVVFNPDPGTGIHWSVATPGTPGGADIQAVGTHEWGHGIGLDHVPLFRSTMFYAAFPGQISLRSLETDDAAAAAHAYPAPPLATDFGVLRGRVDVAGTGDDRGIQVTAIDLVSGFPAASSLSAPSGAYEIRGIPPGAYEVVASPLGTEKVDGGVYSKYWNGSVTGILPAVRGTGGGADGSTGVHVLSAGQVLAGIDLAVSVTGDPGEPNDSTGAASPLALNGSAAARIEDTGDTDFYSFTGTAGRTVSILVHAQHLGSDLNPRVYLRNSLGIQIAANGNISNALHQIEGPDADCRILDFPLPYTGTYFVEVEPEQSVDVSRPEDFFYVLTVLEGGAGTAHPATSTFVASPPVVPADGASSSSLTFVPRTLQGTPLGAGMPVAFELVPDGDADGALLPAVDRGDGSYTASVTAPSSAASDAVSALVDGSPVSTTTVAWRGPADFAASGFLAVPRRLRFDGAATGLLSLLPRDVNGVPFGPGASVTLLLPGSPDAGIGATADDGTGSYEAVLSAGTTEGPVAVGATVEGQAVGGTWTVFLGFPLEPVVDDAVADLAAALVAVPPAPPKALTKLAKAKALLDAVDPLAAPADALAIVTGVRRALGQIEGAMKKGADAGSLAAELAEAVREAARDALDAAAPLADTAAEQKTLVRAENRFSRGEILLEGGRWSKSSARFRAALKMAARVE